VEVTEPELGTYGWGLRFRDPDVEADYRTWRLPHVRTYTLFAMYAGALASAFAFVAVAADAVPGHRRFGLLVITAAIAMHVAGARLTMSTHYARWMMPFSAVDNALGGLMAIVVCLSLDDFAITAGIVAMTAYFGMTMFRMPPLMAFMAVGSYILVVIVLYVVRHSHGDVSRTEFIVGLFIPLTALMTGLVLCLAGERAIRRTYSDRRVIQAQREALFFDHTNMSRFLSAEVRSLVHSLGADATLRPEMLPITVVCSDLRGFTAFCERHGAEAMTTVLRDYYEAVVDSASVFGGTVKDFAGDGVLVLVGAPMPRADHATVGLDLARGLIGAVSKVTGTYATPETPLGIGVGVATGECAVGAIGSVSRLEYTAVGTAVNLASRLCAVAEDGEIVLAPSTARLVDAESSWRDREVTVKGLPDPIAAVVERTRVAHVRRGGQLPGLGPAVMPASEGAG
jgi:class 3 adenylate cyclase